MGKENTSKNYLSGKEIRAIAKANAKEMKRLEAFKKRRASEEEFTSAMKDDNNILEIEDLHTYFFTEQGVVKAVNGVSYNVPKHSVVGVVGESGCGKSVTAKTIMGLIQTPPGEIKKGSQILFEGKNLLDMNEKEWQAYRGSDCAIVFQDALAALNPTLTIGRQITEKIMIHTDMNKEDAMKEAERLLTLVGIPNPAKRLKQ